jgi:hypothetical protein
MLLYFAYADFEETRMKYEKVHQIYQRILELEDLDPTLVRNDLMNCILEAYSFLFALLLTMILMMSSKSQLKYQFLHPTQQKKRFKPFHVKCLFE